jgi:hypothetical protein
VRVGGPDIDARDLVAVALDEPTKGGEPGFNGERRIRPGEVSGRSSQRLRIARRRVAESDRLVEQLRILRGGEPLALLTGRVPNEVRQNDAGGLSGYFFVTARNHRRNVAARFAEIA